MSRVLPILAVFFLASAGCDGGSSDADPRICTLSASETLSSSVTATRFVVDYRAGLSGEGLVASITYLDADGNTVSVSDPIMPWSQSFSMDQGSAARVALDGEVINGSIQVTLEASNGITSYFERDSCSQLK